METTNISFKKVVKFIMCLFLLSCYSPIRSQNLWASKMICKVKVDSISAEIFYKAPKPDYHIKLLKKHPKVQIKKGLISITSNLNDTTFKFFDTFDNFKSRDTTTFSKRVVDSSFWEKWFSFFRKGEYIQRFKYLGYNEELHKHVVYYQMYFDYLKTYIFIDTTSDYHGAYTFAKPVFSPDRKKIVSFQPGRPDLGHDILIHEIEEDELIVIYESPIYKIGDWDIKEIRWIDNNTLVMSAKSPRTTTFGGNVIKQKKCYYKLSLIKCENQ